MINLEIVEHIDWTILLTTEVGDLHAVSHFKHETFSVLQYGTDFGTILIERVPQTHYKVESQILYPSCVVLPCSPVPFTSMP